MRKRRRISEVMYMLLTDEATNLIPVISLNTGESSIEPITWIQEETNPILVCANILIIWLQIVSRLPEALQTIQRSLSCFNVACADDSHLLRLEFHVNETLSVQHTHARVRSVRFYFCARERESIIEAALLDRLCVRVCVDLIAFKVYTLFIGFMLASVR